MRGLVGICAAGLVALGASSAGAAVIFTDNFAADPVPSPPNWVPNDPIFTNFFVGGGTVDLLAAGNPFGLTNSGTTGSTHFVDLDGTSTQGGFLETIQQFSYTAGQTVTLSVDVGGNERFGTDGLFAGFRFFGPADFTNVSTTGFTSTQTPSSPTLELLGISQIANNTPFQTYSISFTALSAGSVDALVGTDSRDQVGPLLDRVTVATTALAASVPEPTGWALMIIGLGGVGGSLRRQRAQRGAVSTGG